MDKENPKKVNLKKAVVTGLITGLVAGLVLIAALGAALFFGSHRFAMTPASPKTEKYYEYNHAKEIKPGIDKNVDEAAVVAKQWFYTRCVKGDMGAEWELLTDDARDHLTKEEYVEKTKQESDDIGHEVKREKDGAITKMYAMDTQDDRVIIDLDTPDGTGRYRCTLVKKVSDGWKVNEFGGGSK